MSLFGKKTYNYITNEIDYEKLAKAIVKANEEIEEKKQKKPSFFTRFIAGLIFGLFIVLIVLIIGFIFIFCRAYINFLQEVRISSLTMSTSLRTCLLPPLIIVIIH